MSSALLRSTLARSLRAVTGLQMAIPRPISHVAHGSVSIKTLPLIAAAQAIFKEAGTTGGLLGAAQRIGTGPWASRTSLLIWRRIVCC